MLSQTQRVRLAKLLGMLGSEHAGERDAAGLAAQRLVRDAKTTWDEVLAQPAAAPKASLETSWRAEFWDTVDACLERPQHLSAWERTFLDSICTRSRLTPKQATCLAGIARRVLGEHAA